MKKAGLNANFAFSMVYRLSICVLPLVITPYISRVLSAQDNGLYVVTSTIACFFIMFCKLGFESYGNRSIAACRDDESARSRVFFGIYAIQLAASALSLALYALMVGCFIRENRSIYWLQMLYVASGLFDVSWFFYGMERFRLTMVRSLLARALIIAGVFAFVRSADDLPAYTCVMAACLLLEQLILFFYLRGCVRPVKLCWRDISCHLLPGLKLFVPIIALSVYHWMDKLMLGLICDNSVVSYYNYAESIINLPKGIIQALSAVMLPRIAYLAARGRTQDCQRMISGAMELICFLVCALCFGIMGVSEVFVPLFLGPKYLPTVLLTVELAVVMIPMCLSEAIQSQYLVPFKRDNLNMISIAVGAAVNLVMNLALIPRFGASGAVIGTLCAEMAVCLFLMIRIRGVFKWRRLLGSLPAYMLFGAAEALLAHLLGSLSLAPLPRLIVMVAAAAALYLALSALWVTYRSRRDPLYRGPLRYWRENRAEKGGDME